MKYYFPWLYSVNNPDIWSNSLTVCIPSTSDAINCNWKFKLPWPSRIWGDCPWQEVFYISHFDGAECLSLYTPSPVPCGPSCPRYPLLSCHVSVSLGRVASLCSQHQLEGSEGWYVQGVNSSSLFTDVCAHCVWELHSLLGDRGTESGAQSLGHFR